MHERCVWKVDRVARRHAGHVHRGVALMKVDGAGVTTSGCDRDQSTFAQRVVHIELLVAGLDAGRVGHHPHLDEVHGVLGAVVHFGVHDPGPGAHALSEPGVEHAVVAGGVTMGEFAIQHPGDDLHVSMPVRAEAGSWGDPVVVRDDQEAVADVCWVVMWAEAEAVSRVEPSGVGVEALVGGADVDGGHGVSSK